MIQAFQNCSASAMQIIDGGDPVDEAATIVGDALQSFVRNGLIGMIANTMLLVGAMVFMLILDWRMALALCYPGLRWRAF